MGERRGQRNRDQDRYWHIRSKQMQTGMVAPSLEATGFCAKCRGLVLREQLYQGWCLSCVAQWVDITDPWLIYQSQSQLPAKMVPVSMMRQMERLEAKIAEPAPDDAFLPLTQFMGHKGVGSQKSMWNFLNALYIFELHTTEEAHKLGVICPNTVHLCGRHAPVLRMSLQGFLSRIKSAGTDFTLLRQDRHLADYLNGFVADNRISLCLYRRTGIDVFDRVKTLRFVAKYGQTHFDKHQPTYWPFESEHDGRLRKEGKLDEMPDVVMEVGQLVPLNAPHSLRDDLCQDLVVAVLTGEATIDQLRHEATMKQFVRRTFENNPLRYGRFSLDQPSPHDDFKGEDYMLNRDLVTSDDTSAERAERSWLGALCVDPDETHHGWHEGRDRPRGLATVADVARQNQGGYAINGPHVVRTPEEIDEDIAEVFYADQHPQWRRKLSD